VTGIVIETVIGNIAITRAASTEHDSGKGPRLENQPRNAGRLILKVGEC